MKLVFGLLAFVFAIHTCHAANAASVMADVAAKVKSSNTNVLSSFQVLKTAITTLITTNNKNAAQLATDTSKTLTSSVQKAMSEILKAKNATVKAQVATVIASVTGVQTLSKTLGDTLVGLRNNFLSTFNNQMANSLESLKSTLNSFSGAAENMITNDNLIVKNIVACEKTAFDGFNAILKNISNEATACVKTYTANDVTFNGKVTLTFKKIGSVGGGPLGTATLCLKTNQLTNADSIDKASDCNRMSFLNCMDLSTINPGVYATGFAGDTAALEVSFNENADSFGNCLKNMETKATSVAQKIGLAFVNCLTG